MALPITIPYTFANATSSIPLSNLDSDFTTVVNAINGIGNGTNSLANVSITGGSIDNVAIGSTTTSTGKFTTVTATTGNITTINATTLNAATYRSDTSLTFQTNGTTTAMTVDTSQNVGIGTSSPGYVLDINKNIGTNSIRLGTYQDTSKQWLLDNTNGAFTINGSGANSSVFSVNVAGSQRMIIDNSGNVGIGTSSPGNKLQVQATGTTQVRVAEATGTYYFDFGRDTTDGLFQFIGNQGLGYKWINASTEAMRINSSGNVGIGTSSPNWRLQLNVTPASTANYLQITNGSTGTAAGDGMLVGVDSSNDAIVWMQESANLKFATSNTERMRIDSSGNVGIGATANASAILDAQSTTKGVRFPNMTTTQKNAVSSPAAGLVVFDTTLAKLCVYSGAAWQTITSV